jgi:hypothetical protein
MGIATNKNVCAVFKTRTLGGRLAATPLFRALGKRFGENAGVVADSGTADFLRTNPYGIKVFNYGENIPNYCTGERPSYLDDIQKLDYGTVMVLPWSEWTYADLSAHGVFSNSIQRIGDVGFFDDLVMARKSSFPGFFGSELAFRYYKDHAALNREVRIPFPEPYKKEDCGKFIGDSFLEYIRAMGISESDSSPEVWSTKEDRIAAQKHLQQCGVTEEDLLIGINVQGATVQWPMEYAAKIIKYFLSRDAEDLLERKVKIFTNYSFAESGYANRLMSLLSEESRIIPSPIPGNHRLSAELIKRCSYLITTQNAAAVLAQSANIDTPCSVLYNTKPQALAWRYPGARVMQFTAHGGTVDNIPAKDVYLGSIAGILEWCKK